MTDLPEVEEMPETDEPAPEPWRPACDDRRIFRRFDFNIIGMVRPNDGWNITRCLDVILYFLELGDRPQYTHADRWTTYDLAAFMSGVGRGADYNDPLALSNCHDAWQAVRWAVLGGTWSGSYVERWRKDNRIHVDEKHRVVTNHVRSSDWNGYRNLDRFLAGPHTRPGVRLGDRPGTLLLIARPIGDDGHGRRWRWNLCAAGWRHKGPVVTQELGETVDAMLTRGRDYLASVTRPGAAFVDWDFSGGGGWHYALYRMGAQESEDRATWEQVSGTFKNVNDAVKSAISLNNQSKEGAK